jgi:heptosyltransferase-2
VTLPSRDSMSDIVWLATGFLGDLILTTAGIDLAAKFFPQAKQHVITTSLGVVALAGSSSITSLIPFEKRGKSTWTAMRSTTLELRSKLTSNANPVLLQVHRSIRSGLLARSIGLPTITYKESEWATHAATKVPRVATLHEAARIALLLEPLGIPRSAIVQAKPVLPSLPLLGEHPWQVRLQKWHQSGQRIVGIAPGSVWGTKRWTQDGFVALIRLILRETRDTVVLLGSSAEKALCTEIMTAVGSHNERLLDLCAATSLDDLRRVYPVLSALVSNDSSPLHYGSAFNIPTVALFGATIPEMGFGPLASRSHALGIELECRPCSDHGPQVCPKQHFRCMRELTAERVFTVLRDL